jgi:hypothetical protein
MTRPMRYIMLLLLLPALAAVPAMAVCADGSGKRCCCSDKGRCHMPERDASQTPQCCDESGGAPPVPASRLAGGDEPSTWLAIVAAEGPADATLFEAHRPGVVGSEQTHPPPVTLFTLHAAFLI